MDFKVRLWKKIENVMISEMKLQEMGMETVAEFEMISEKCEIVIFGENQDVDVYLYLNGDFYQIIYLHLLLIYSNTVEDR
jgi:hypothetical protein